MTPNLFQRSERLPFMSRKRPIETSPKLKKYVNVSDVILRFGQYYSHDYFQHWKLYNLLQNATI